MKLFWNYIEKCKAIFFTYAHGFKVLRYGKKKTEHLPWEPIRYKRVLLKPMSKRWMTRFEKVLGLKCNCVFCNTINNKTQTWTHLRLLTRSGWRVHWTMFFKFMIFFQLYNYLSLQLQQSVYFFRGTVGEVVSELKYKSIYLFFRDAFLTSWILYKASILNLIYKKNQPIIELSWINLKKQMKKELKNGIRHFFKNQLKIFLIQQYIFLFYEGVKTFILSILISMIFFVMLLITMKVTLLQHLAIWFIFGNIFFWLMSGFNFFIKRARFGKFTARLQRFWKHSFVSFWVVEGFLFSLFFYYFLNSSQEPLYMYDYNNVHNDFILNLQSGFFSTFLLTSILFGCQLLAIFISVRSTFQSLLLLTLISFGVFYLFFIESYQIYYVLNGYSDVIYIFDEEQNIWVLDYESIKLRTKHWYFIMCVIAKFWHFIFIFFSWIFFLSKAFELRKISHNLLSFNYQNLLILFVLNLLCYCNWVRFLFRRCIDLSYFWFFLTPDLKLLKLVVEEAIYIILSCSNKITKEMQLQDIYQFLIY